MASNMFLKIGDVKGESKESKHKEWIDVESYSEGLVNTGSSSFGGGAGTGVVQYSDFNITCQLEKAIPTLMNACATLKHYPTATLDCIKMGTDSFIYLQIILEDVVVASVQKSGAMNSLPHVSVALNFAKIHTQYWEQAADGSQGTSTEAKWDQKENKTY
ncbi:MAG: type VI secretion system tube protein Hcp [Rhodoferax sp.]|jgi:type VI secretion system secreted protein Hcp|nr:type VI secretion system tube protein Hcp [Rhodoferax sp.]